MIVRYHTYLGRWSTCFEFGRPMYAPAFDIALPPLRTVRVTYQ